MKPSAEDIEQIKVIEFVKQCTDLPVWHTANQRQTSPRHGSMLKRMGVLSGVADLFFPRSNKIHKGLFIEMKTLTGKPTKTQMDFLFRMVAEGYAAKVCYGAEHAIDMIKSFYDL